MGINTCLHTCSCRARYFSLEFSQRITIYSPYKVSYITRHSLNWLRNETLITEISFQKTEYCSRENLPTKTTSMLVFDAFTYHPRAVGQIT